jgi:serine protease
MQLQRLVRLALASAPLLVCGCWPLAPIAALAAAGGGGGGGSDGGITLVGAIVTDGTVFGSSLRLDREPNEALGSATELPFDATRARRGDGATGVAIELHALTATPEGARIVASDLLSDAASSHESAGDPATTHLARSGRELFEVRATADGRAELVVTPLVSGFAKRRTLLDLPLAPAGAAACMDALLLLDNSTMSSRLVAFDAEDGAPLAIHDLGRPGLAHLAGATALASGRERLFTCDPIRGTLFEIAIAESGPARTLGTLVALPIAPRPIAALAYDGLLLHVVGRDGTLVSYDADDAAFAPAGTSPFATAGQPVRSLVATLALGVDAWHVELPAHATLRISLAANRAVDGTSALFLAAQPRATTLAGAATPPAHFRRFAADGQRVAFELTTAEVAQRFDLWLGSLAGSAHYQLALNGVARAPTVVAAPRTGADAGLTARVETLLQALPAPRLAALCSDPLLPDFVPERLLLGRRDAAGALTLPPAPRGFALAREERNPGGFDRVRVTTTAEWSGPAPRRLQGATTRRARRREEGRALLAACDGLAGARDVAWCEPDWIVRSLATPNDPGYAANQQWHYQMLNLPAAWDLTRGSSSTVLAVVDTGARSDNVDLNANLSPDGYDFITGSNSGDADPGRDSDEFDQGTFASNAHHGSHCGGVMGAQGNNATQGSGICWDCELMALRALGTDGNGSVSDIADAIRYAARLSNASGLLPAARASVLNLSLGLGTPSTTIRNAVDAAINAGTVVCAAAGNDGNGEAILYPAAFDEVIAVAALAFNGGIAFYSNTGPELDVACPGGSNLLGQPAKDIWSTSGVGAGGSLQPLAGTSMACAHASGVVGLIATQFPAITQAEAEELLRSTAIDLGAPGFDDVFGYGGVDAAAAVNDATALLHLPASELDFGETGTRLLLQAVNAGGGRLEVTSVTAASAQTPLGVPPTTAWLAIAPLVDGTTFQLTADRTGLAAGDYQLQLDVDSNGGFGSLFVDLTAGGSGLTDVGEILVQLVDEDGTTVLASRRAQFGDGYAFSFGGLARGRGFVRCGVDLDGDDVLGELGEPYGAYPSVAEEALLELNGGNVGLDLVLQ